MTAEQRRRIETALRETIDALARAERYSPDLRDQKLIASYNRHIQKLHGLLGA
jgi:hypothetical protein